MTSIKITQMIKILKKIKETEGDLDIYLSSDPEGNSYGTVDKSSFGKIGDKGLAIYPFEENLDYNDIVK